MDGLFPAADVMDQLSSYVVAFTAYGIGLALILWMLGYVIWFIIDFLR